MGRIAFNIEDTTEALNKRVFYLETEFQKLAGSKCIF